MKVYLTEKEAQGLLGVDAQRLAEFEQAGLLVPVETTPKKKYQRWEVISLMETADSHRLASITPELLRAILAEFRRLRVEVDVLLRLLGIANPPLSTSLPKLALLYDKVLDALAQEHYTQQEAENWSHMILRLRDAHLVALTSATNHDRPWVVFQRLVDRLLSWVHNGSPVEENTYLHKIFLQLEAARRHLRDIAYNSELMNPSRDHETQMSKLLPNEDEILAEVFKMRGSTSLPPAIDTLTSLLKPHNQ